MGVLLDKLILLVCCFSIGIITIRSEYAVVPVIFSILASSLMTYYDKKWLKISLFLLFVIISIFIKSFVFFIPLIIYDAVSDDKYWLCVAGLIPVALNIVSPDYKLYIFVLLLVIFSILLRKRTDAFYKLQKEHFKMRDENKEYEYNLKNKNRELLEKQDYEINLATLNERNRISREIHDGVGHLLTRSILQIGALMITVKDEAARQKLGEIKNTLDTGMDSIRNSIHNLYDDSVDINIELRKLADNFTYCDLDLDCHLTGEIDNKVKYTIISIVKEALTNISKHSNATRAAVTFREHPAIYQLVISDNGCGGEYLNTNGIGLKNIESRVNAFNGNINITNNKGFRIFITIPKGD